MDPEIPDPPPEAHLIRIARDAAGMTAADAARATAGVVGATYWRDVERGHGGRRGKRVRATASARTLAHMAQVVGVSPERLAGEGQRPDAAEILREIIRQDSPAPAAPAPDRESNLPYLDNDSGETGAHEVRIMTEILSATEQHGPNPPAEVIFPADPGKPVPGEVAWERAVWADEHLPRETRVRIIAIGRVERERAAGRQRRGRAGLWRSYVAPPVT